MGVGVLLFFYYNRTIIVLNSLCKLKLKLVFFTYGVICLLYNYLGDEHLQSNNHFSSYSQIA